MHSERIDVETEFEQGWLLTVSDRYAMVNPGIEAVYYVPEKAIDDAGMMAATGETEHIPPTDEEPTDLESYRALYTPEDIVKRGEEDVQRYTDGQVGGKKLERGSIRRGGTPSWRQNSLTMGKEKSAEVPEGVVRFTNWHLQDDQQHRNAMERAQLWGILQDSQGGTVPYGTDSQGTATHETSIPAMLVSAEQTAPILFLAAHDYSDDEIARALQLPHNKVQEELTVVES